MDRNTDQFINRKGVYSLNVLVTGGIDRLIYDLLVNVPGSFHDAAANQMSQVKPYLESRFPREICLGDSAFPISDVLITPYSQEVERRNPEIRLFNYRHSAARVEMTECIYGIWKRRFPIIKSLRVHLPNAYKVITATAILHNLSVMWGEILGPDPHPDLPAELAENYYEPQENIIVDYAELPPQVRRRLGQEARDNMREAMDPRPNAEERENLH